MFFTLVADGHHASLSLGLFYNDMNKWTLDMPSETNPFPAWKVDYGYRFFIGKSHWFVDPTFNGLLFPISMNVECRGDISFHIK